MSKLFLEANFFEDDGEGSTEITKYGYIGYYVVILMVCLPLFAFHFLFLIKECNKSLKDVFRIIQIIILLEYLLMIILLDGLRFLETGWFCKKFLFFFGMIGYFLSDLINITCWALLLIHTKYYTNSLSRNSVEGLRSEILSIINKIRKWEKCILYLLASFIFIFAAFSFAALPFCPGCKHCPKEDWNNWSNTCQIVENTANRLAESFSVLGIIVSIFKLILGCFMLYMLKNHLNFYYRAKISKILIAIFLTCVSNTIKLVNTFNQNINNLSLKVKYTDKKPIQANELWYSLPLAILLRVLPILVITVNIQLIYYTCYLRNLMKGCGIGDYLKVCSIFMKSSKNIYEILEEDQKDSFWNKNSTLIGDDGNQCEEDCSLRQTSFCKNRAESLNLSEAFTENSEIDDLYKKEYERIAEMEKEFRSTRDLGSTVS
ncbi:unnamed protein product [Moneuplotes crassus]|uniref:Uncharacterized protein n=1 Tax=Euplotes crassus TaxID=5936 RepID=A0AAD1URT8_EUPCR|nr:unnamed protein product [Moneuplotes crassus]